MIMKQKKHITAQTCTVFLKQTVKSHVKSAFVVLSILPAGTLLTQASCYLES